MLAMRRRAAVQLDLSRLRDSIDTLRAFARDPQSRFVLANLAGLVACYKKTRVAAVRFTPNAPAGFVAAFEDLVQSSLYLEATRTTFLMGLPSRAKRAASELRRIVKDLAHVSAFRKILSLGIKSVSLVTGTTLPDLPIESPPGSAYLPPIVTFRAELAKGMRYWQLLEPEFSPLSRQHPEFEIAWVFPWDIDKEVHARTSWLDVALPNLLHQDRARAALARAPNL
jgi:hypothetical protein